MSRTCRIPPLVAGLALLIASPGVLPADRAAAAGGSQVQMAHYAFSPADLTVPAGSTVTWTNQDTAPHDATVSNGPAHFHSPQLAKGQSWSFTFATPGSYTYFCTVHPDMTAHVVVQPAPAPAAPAAPAPARTTAPGPSAAGGPHSATRPAAALPAAPASASSAGSAVPAADQPATAIALPGETMPTGQPLSAAAASAGRPLDPLLLLAGLVTGVAVLCLLLVGSRSAAAHRE